MSVYYKNPYFIFISLLSAFIIFFNSTSGTFFNSDDYIYAEIVKQISIKGQWLDLYWQNFAYITKPPLYFWCASAFSMIFGLNEFSLRLPSMIFGFATVLVVFVYTRKKTNDRSALIAALSLMGFQLFLNFSRRAMLDVPLVFFITLSIIAFIEAVDKSKWFYIAWISAGLAFLTKGYVFFPAVLIPFLYYVLNRKASRFVSPDSLKAFAIMMMMILPWQLYHLFSKPEFFIKRFFSDQIINHYMGGGDSYFSKPVYFYIKTFAHLDPWISVLFLISIAIFALNFKKISFTRFCVFLTWIFACLIIYSLSSSKLEHYMIVVYPAIGIFTAMAFNEIRIKNKNLVIWLVIFLLLIINIINFIPYIPDKGGYSNPSGEIKNLVRKYNEVSPKESILYLYNIYLPAPVFYADTKVISIETDKKKYKIMQSIPEFNTTDSLLRLTAGQFRHFIETRKHFYCLIKKKHWENIAEIRGKLKQIATEGEYVLFSYGDSST